jgi:hypothetical protein
MEWPIVSIIIVTYYRPEEIRRTIAALVQHIQYPEDRLRWHLADDRSSEWQGEQVGDWTPERYLDDVRADFVDLRFSMTITERAGWGVNVNKAMLYCWDKHGPYTFLCEDDYVSRGPIRLREGVALLVADQDIGVVRYDGIAGHALNLELRECSTQIGKVPRLLILKNSPFLNVYSNRPHLKAQRFHDTYGMYPEGESLGQTETKFAQRVKRKKAGPGVVVLKDGVDRGFDHIGKSRQHTKDDKNG